jgi:hypothetical protein
LENRFFQTQNRRDDDEEQAGVQMMNKIAFLSLILCLCVFSNSFGAFVYWGGGMKDGSATAFDWFNGGSDNGLFGDPVLVGGNTFVFTPQNFRADSLDGVSGTAADRLKVTLVAKPGQMITGIRITEFGDYGITGNGEVRISGGLFMTNMVEFDVADSELNVVNPATPITSGAGNWKAVGEITGLDWTNVNFVMDNNLQAVTVGSGSNSYVQKKITGGSVTIEIIPEPASLGLLGLGTLFLVRNRKK